MAFERRKRRLIFSWTTGKGLLAILLYLAVAFALEYVVIVAFSSYGLTDNMPLTGSLRVPGSDSIFTVSISPVFHLIPLSVIVTLLSSWMHLTRCLAVIPSEMAMMPKKQIKKKETPKRSRFKDLKWRLERTNLIIKASFRRLGNLLLINRVSHLWSQSHFARAAVKGSVALFSLFLFLAFTLYLAERPTFLYEFVAQFYRDNPHFLGFVLGIREAFLLLAQSLSSLGLATSSINSWITAVAVGFRDSISNLVAPLAKKMVELDILWKYLICQNVAAWMPALLVLLYGQGHYGGSS